MPLASWIMPEGVRICGLGLDMNSTPFARLTTMGILSRSLTTLPILPNTDRMSVLGIEFMIMSASQTASNRSVTTVRGLNGISSMFSQNPSVKTSSADRVLSPRRASTYFRYLPLCFSLLMTSLSRLMDSKIWPATCRFSFLPSRRQMLNFTLSFRHLYCFCSMEMKTEPHAPAPSPTTCRTFPGGTFRAFRSASARWTSSSLTSASARSPSWKLSLRLS
mmetsp:Transcript_2088/g.6238  ORF Transcript_2088/g.6238 Transcript_2088/m.6238 type:complete len:220 (-) Transcript_2088:181-840(-)